MDDAEDEYATVDGIGVAYEVDVPSSTTPEAPSNIRFHGISSFDDKESEPSAEWSKELGFPDPYGVLRIWLDDDDLITKVRIVPTWRDKLKDIPLDAAFCAAFMLINNYQLNQRTYSEPQLLDESTNSNALITEETVEALSATSDALSQRMSQLTSDDVGHWEGAETVGSAAQGHVLLRLDIHGRIAGIQFSPQWLHRSTVRSVSLAVVHAHRDARARWQEPIYVPGKADELAQQSRQALSRILSLLHGSFG